MSDIVQELEGDGAAFEDALLDMGPFETLKLTHMQVDGYSKTFYAAATEITALRDEVERLNVLLEIYDYELRGY